jgi:hypothetical protein
MGLYKKIDMNTDPLPLSLFPPGAHKRHVCPFGGEKVHRTFSRFRLTPQGEGVSCFPCPANSDRVSFPLYGGRAGWGLLHIRFKPYMPPPPGDMF